MGPSSRDLRSQVPWYCKEALLQKHGFIVPPLDQLQPWLPGTSRFWPSARERDMLGIVNFTAAKLGKADFIFRPPHAVWNVSRSIFRMPVEWSLVERVAVKAPCVLCRHKLWDTRLQREVLPIEKMMLMGFPRNIHGLRIRDLHVRPSDN